MFDRPQFKLIPQAMEVQYANVSNCLDVTTRRGDHTVFVEVDTSLFTIMAALGVKLDSEVTMYLEYHDQRWLFGLVIDDEQLIDLWYYLPDSVPRSILLGEG